MKGNLVFFFLLGVADLVRSAEEVFAEGPRAQNKNINNVDELRLALSEEMRRQDQKFAEWEKRRLEEIREEQLRFLAATEKLRDQQTAQTAALQTARDEFQQKMQAQQAAHASEIQLLKDALRDQQTALTAALQIARDEFQQKMQEQQATIQRGRRRPTT